MKNLILFSIISLLLVSCGQKGESSKARFKLFTGNIVDPLVTFPGGLMVMGRKLDGSQSFMLPFNPGMELELSKGGWEFATIGWMGQNKMEGNQQCSYQRVDIGSDIFTVNFNMNYQACVQAITSEGDRFTEPRFYNRIGGAFNGFKKLSVQTCPNLYTDCTALTHPASFRVEIKPDLKGVSGSIGALTSFSSNCIVGTTNGLSNITPPHGGAMGIVDMTIHTFSDSTCSTGKSSYYFDSGFGQALDESQPDQFGNYFLRRGVLSVSMAGPAPYIVSVGFAPFMGDHSVFDMVPVVTGSTPALYSYTGNANMYILTHPLDGAIPGEYLYYNGTDWLRISSSDTVKLILQH